MKTSSCIELASEPEEEQDLDLGGRGGTHDDWHLLGGSGGGFGLGTWCGCFKDRVNVAHTLSNSLVLIHN